jgi:hypothetical protein
MTITREVNGKEVEFSLTPVELYNAFEEQQHIFDVEDVKNYFDGYSEADFIREYGRPGAEIRLLFGEVAYEMRRNIDKYDMDWFYAREAAISELL